MSCIYLFSLRGIRGRYSSSIRQMDKIKNTWRECELITKHVACCQCNFMGKGYVWLPPQACPGLMTLAPWCTTWWLRFPTHCYTWLTLLLQHLSRQITEVTLGLPPSGSGSGCQGRVVVVTPSDLFSQTWSFWISWPTSCSLSRKLSCLLM